MPRKKTWVTLDLYYCVLCLVKKIKNTKMQNQNQSQLIRCEQKRIHSLSACLFLLFSPLVPVACIPALWARLFQCLPLIFPPLAPVAYFSALGACCLFSRAWRLLLIFPRLVSVVCIPAFGARLFLLSPPLVPASCFPALCACCLYLLLILIGS